MNHDEAIRVLKLHQEWRMGREPYDKAGCPMPHSPKGLTAALDCAIAYMEPKPTQFDERVTEILLSHYTPEECAALIRDMLDYIQKLEKGQSDGRS